MTQRLRRWVLLFTPPIISAVFRRIRSRLALRGVFGLRLDWECVPDNDATWSQPGGWSHESIAATQQSKWQGFLASTSGRGPLGHPREESKHTPTDIGEHNTIMSFAYAIGRVAVGRSTVSVLDWGGGLGHYYVFARELFPEVEFKFVVKDLPRLCKIGASLLPEVTFLSDDEVALSGHYDLVFASSSLHYSRDCHRLLGRLAGSAIHWLMVTRVPIINEYDDFVVVQRPQASGYMTEYPGWFMNRKRLIDSATRCSFTLEREFLVAERPYVPNAPEQARYRGFLFRRTSL
jgi:putative methyltransferase (TIGR04325 family)